jgi:hypothetical protein
MLQPGPTTPGKHRDSGPEWSATRNGHSPDADHGIMSVNFRADRFKRTRLHPLRIDWLNPESPMKPTIKDTAVVDNFKQFLDVHRAIPI